MPRTEGAAMFFLFRGLPVLIEIGLLVYCLIDCVQSPPHLVRTMPRWAWALVIVVLPFFGSLSWLVFGRPVGDAAEAGWSATGPGSSHPGYDRPRRPRTVAPDDDPDFLNSLRKKRDDGPAGDAAGSADPQH